MLRDLRLFRQAPSTLNHYFCADQLSLVQSYNAHVSQRRCTCFEVHRPGIVIQAPAGLAVSHHSSPRLWKPTERLSNLPTILCSVGVGLNPLRRSSEAAPWEERARRSSLATTTTSPGCSAFMSLPNSGRPSRFLPLCFSLKMRSQPAAFRASTWAA